MKNLTTQKIVLGILMAFVLAFGVQGIADAITTTSSGDNAVTSSTRGTAVIAVATIADANPRSFTLRVTAAEDGDSVNIPTPTNATITEIKTTSAPSDPASDPDDGADPDPSPAKDDIVSGTTITFGGLGNKDDRSDRANPPTTTTGDPNTGSWTFKVTYTVTNFGYYSIDVDNNDADPDIEAYVVQSKGKAASYEIDKTAASDITQTPQVRGRNIEVEVVEGNTAQGWVQVDLSITNGKLRPTGFFLSGSRIYDLNDANDNGYTSLSVFTATDGTIDVTVDQTRDRTATVTAKISGVTGEHASHTVTYFYDGVTIARVSGNYQHAKTNTSLAQPLVVRVLDGTRPVRDQRVRFTATDGTLSAASFIRETGSAQGTAALSVRTDSRGDAKVNLRVHGDAEGITVNAAVASTPPAPGTTVAELGTSNQFQTLLSAKTRPVPWNLI